MTTEQYSIGYEAGYQDGWDAALAEQSAEQEPVAQRWQPIETAPKGRIVLVHYKNSLGNGRTMRARYYLPETLDSDTTESGWADEGWYEESEAYEYLMPLDHEPTHWMPLPAAPDTAPQPKAMQQADHYGIIDPDYARVFTQARIIAHQYGYACVMHGSFTRDLDLLMVPWTEQATDNREQLLKLIAGACGLRFRDGNEDVIKSNPDFTIKPHGRTACSLYFPKFGDHRWVDISFVPCVPQPAKQPLTDDEIDALELPPSGTATVRDLVRLIERAHGIGETK